MSTPTLPPVVSETAQAVSQTAERLFNGSISRISDNLHQAEAMYNAIQASRASGLVKAVGDALERPAVDVARAVAVNLLGTR